MLVAIRRRCVRLSVLALGVLVAEPAFAAAVTYAFTGHLTRVALPDPKAGLVVGAPFSGRFTIDDSVALMPVASRPGVYGSDIVSTAGPAVEVGGVLRPTTAIDGYVLAAFNDAIGTNLGLDPSIVADGFVFGGIYSPILTFGLKITFLDSSHTFFPSGVDPSLPGLDLVRLFDLSQQNPVAGSPQVDMDGILGVLDSLHLVPEPSAFAGAVLVLAIAVSWYLLRSLASGAPCRVPASRQVRSHFIY